MWVSLKWSRITGADLWPGESPRWLSWLSPSNFWAIHLTPGWWENYFKKFFHKSHWIKIVTCFNLEPFVARTCNMSIRQLSCRPDLILGVVFWQVLWVSQLGLSLFVFLEVMTFTSIQSVYIVFIHFIYLFFLQLWRHFFNYLT